MKEQNINLGDIEINVEIQPDGLFDVYIARIGDSGVHYADCSLERIGKLVAEQVLIMKELETEV